MKRQGILSALTGLLLLTSVTASALELEDAKRQGLVGEMATGYLGVVAGGNNAAESLVREVNAQRRQAYENIAKKRNVSMRDVELLAGKKAIDKTPRGQYVNTGRGWVRK